LNFTNILQAFFSNKCVYQRLYFGFVIFFKKNIRANSVPKRLVKFTLGVNFTNALCLQIPKAQKDTGDMPFFASTNVKAALKYVDYRAQFHQCSTYSFYARRSRMRKKDSQVSSVIWRF
jgi:hypothetical protein